jgi:hypothetical protein
MKLQDYLKAIRECPDEDVNLTGRRIPRLTADFGVYDNFSIHFNGDLARTIFDFFWQLGLKPNAYCNGGGGNISYYFLGTNKVITHLLNHLNRNTPEDEGERIHYEFQGQRYNLTIMLHELGYGHQARRLTASITNLAEYFVRKQIEFCMPESVGWAHHGDFSRVVYYPDEVEAEMCGVRK